MLTMMLHFAVQEWIPDMVWLNVVALSSMTALHDIPDSVFRNDGLWRQWYDAEAPETANVPDYEDRLSKFERMCVVKVCLAENACAGYLISCFCCLQGITYWPCLGQIHCFSS